MNALRKMGLAKGWVLGLALLGLALPVAAQAGVFRYVKIGDHCTITGYNGPGGKVVVPGIIDGLGLDLSRRVHSGAKHRSPAWFFPQA